MIGTLLTASHTTTVTLYKSRDEDSHTIGLVEFRDRLNEYIEKIDPQFLSTAEIEIQSYPGWEGCSSATIEITFERPETAMETTRRINEEDMRQRDSLERARKEYERLKAVFEA